MRSRRRGDNTKEIIDDLEGDQTNFIMSKMRTREIDMHPLLRGLEFDYIDKLFQHSDSTVYMQILRLAVGNGNNEALKFILSRKKDLSVEQLRGLIIYVIDHYPGIITFQSINREIEEEIINTKITISMILSTYQNDILPCYVLPRDRTQIEDLVLSKNIDGDEYGLLETSAYIIFRTIDRVSECDIDDIKLMVKILISVNYPSILIKRLLSLIGDNIEAVVKEDPRPSLYRLLQDDI